MITLHRNKERHHGWCRKHEVWLTFHPQHHTDPHAVGFGTPTSLYEIQLSPGRGTIPQLLDEAEIVTYVYKGVLARKDSTGHSGVVHAGEFQCMTTGNGIRHRETNASRRNWAHIFRISLDSPVAGIICAHEQKHFSVAQRSNVLCVVASQDGRKGSLRIHQDALICSGILYQGHHAIHELLPGRCAWLHIICGEATLNDVVLTRGDSAGFRNEPSVSLTAHENTEILLVDLGPAPRSLEHRRCENECTSNVFGGVA